MKSWTTQSFRKRLAELPAAIRRLAVKNFKLWRRDPHHAALHFKKVGKYWSARVGIDYRALGLMKEDGVLWFWIGPHHEYDQLLRLAF